MNRIKTSGLITLSIAAMVLLLIQHITFKNIGIPSLKNKILLNFDLNENEINDKAYIRGYYSTDCSVGDPPNHYSLDLESKKDLIKKKLKINSIHFADINTSDWSDTTVNNYDIYYQAFVSSNSIGNLYDFYQCNLQEDLFYPKDDNYERSRHKLTSYRWILFFWI